MAKKSMNGVIFGGIFGFLITFLPWDWWQNIISTVSTWIPETWTTIQVIGPYMTEIVFIVAGMIIGAWIEYK